MERYKIIKTIRFKLEECENSIAKLDCEVKKIKMEQDFYLDIFVAECKIFISSLIKHLYCKDKNNNINYKLKKSIGIKKSWLKLYAKDIYYKNPQTSNLKIREFSIGKIEELNDLMQQWLERFKELTKLLDEKATEEKHNSSRHSAIGLLIRKMSTRNNFQLISSFIDNSNTKSEIGALSLQIKNSKAKIESMLQSGLKKYLPSQSSGFPLAKASFNYYTIFKNPVDFGEKIKQQKESLIINSIDRGINGLNTYYDKKKNKNQIFLRKEILQLVIDDIKKLIENDTLLLGYTPDLENDSVLFLRQILKNIKSEQKKAFNELMQKENLNYTNFKFECKLFLFKNISENEFETYKNITKQIEEKARIRNSSDNNNLKKQLMSEIELLKQKRGKAINAADKSTNGQFVTYKSFCNFYGNVAKKHGKILNLINGIKKEKIESQQLKYWALIAEEENKHMLVLIPKEDDKARECRNFIVTNQNSSGNKKIYWLESLTLRSLRKLCFGYVENNTETNTFYPEIKKEFYKTKFKYFKNNKFLQGEYQLKTENVKIEFYKDVLTSEYVKKVLNLPFKQLQEEVLNKKFDSLEDFAIALEKICYRIKVICENDIIQKLRLNYNAQILEITNLDLRNKEKINLKTHTQLWKLFWSENNKFNGFDIRLNPEITISWRDAEESVVGKYGKGSKLYDKNKRNRYLEPQYTLITTISENSNSQTKNISFMEQDEFEKQIDYFNENIKKDDVKFAIGIDNGIVELSSLCLYVPEFKTHENISNQDKKFNLKTTKYRFPVLTIIDKENEKKCKIIKNPSYFLNREFFKKTFNATDLEYDEMKNKYFKEDHLLTIDLTMAKIINGNIVINGDIGSFLSLKLKDAQKIIYELNDHIKKETDKKIIIKYGSELTEKEIDEINKNRKDEKKYNNEDEAFDFFAIVFIANHLSEIKAVFKNREYFSDLMEQDQIKEKLKQYNIKKEISNEELSLKINHLKKSIVSNMIGIIDFLYRRYKSILGGDGIIIKEGFDTKKVEADLKSFQGNIYRMLEWGLYKKFQNYGLVPPIKNLLSIRGDGIDDGDKNKIMRLGNIGFVSKANTSQDCPVCGEKDEDKSKNLENKKKKIFLCDNQNCTFSSEGIMHSNDGIAAFNIAKRGFQNFINENIEK
jgi:hypothetical protein